jgi:phosphoglucosamine mutase
MTGRPARLQGTDGVRGEVAALGDERLSGISPVEAFIRHRLVSPEFVELYCQAFVLDLLETGLAKKGDEIVVGFDPRDRDRRLLRAAIEGIARAGARPVNIGVMPTPGVGLQMVASGASGAVVITASHNPADQNGVKLFLPRFGLKPFPADDERLTAKIYELEREVQTSGRPAHEAVDGVARARGTFEKFFADGSNSWLVPSGGDFSDTLLVVDCANGALSELAGPVFQGYGFGEIVMTGAAPGGAVNAGCGAGLLEGHGRIDAEYISPAGADFRKVELIQALFHHGRALRGQLREGRRRVSGAAFDADGDRFYRLEYDPFEDAVLVLSGDEIAYHQAWFIRRSLGERYNGASIFATTVESDINAGVAAEALGFIPVSTAVGDKWLLREAACQLLGTYWEVLNSNIDSFEVLERIEKREGEFTEAAGLDAVGLTGYLSEAERLAVDHDVDIGRLSQNPELLTFAIGSEETGHSVTAGRVDLPDGRQRIVYFGNGLKSALNLFAATRELARESAGQEYYCRLHRPFEPGFKRTMPVYYTDRERLAKGSAAYRRLRDRLLAGGRKRFDGRLESETVEREEEPGMLYLALNEPGRRGREKLTRAAVFLRNSGTEEKTSVYLRGDRLYSNDLNGFGEEITVELSGLMKRSDSPYARAETAVLLRLSERGEVTLQQLSDLLGEVDPQRLLIEMTVKQGLLRTAGDKLALTDLGRLVVQKF